MKTFSKGYETALIPPDVVALLEKHRYHLVGRHSAVKRCLWVKKRLIDGIGCYKEKFYGIQSHRCLQMSPAHVFCTHHCLFCWRIQPQDSQNQWDDRHLPEQYVDPPEAIVEQSIAVHKKILAGFNPEAHPKVEAKLYQEAIAPKHAAISLSGEPTIYPYISGLIDSFHRHGLTTFLVTNGTRPEILSGISEPTQLYVSLPASNKKTYKMICRPTKKGLWAKLKATLELLPSFSCPTVLRLTLVKNYNLADYKGFARLISLANPTYVEAKGYMHVGWSRKRLQYSDMPSHREIMRFAQNISDITGYNILDESPISRVTLLSKRKKPIRFC
ncbi:MAG: 4-demethylwyosine synthase TYW1 [Candidatus Ranarchaeia archaeon]